MFDHTSLPAFFAADLDASLFRRSRSGDFDSCESWFAEGHAPSPREAALLGSRRRSEGAAILFPAPCEDC